jgi:hypothetical protein
MDEDNEGTVETLGHLEEYNASPKRRKPLLQNSRYSSMDVIFLRLESKSGSTSVPSPGYTRLSLQPTLLAASRVGSLYHYVFPTSSPIWPRSLASHRTVDLFACHSSEFLGCVARRPPNPLLGICTAHPCCSDWLPHLSIWRVLMAHCSPVGI